MIRRNVGYSPQRYIVRRNVERFTARSPAPPRRPALRRRSPAPPRRQARRRTPPRPTATPPYQPQYRPISRNVEQSTVMSPHPPRCPALHHDVAGGRRTPVEIGREDQRRPPPGFAGYPL